MKFLKVLLIIIVIVAVVVGVLAVVAPNEFKTERSIIIDAPVPLVMSQVSSFENMNKWSPWAEKDPDMKTEIIGTDGEVGAIYKWDGNSEVGTGTQELTLITDNRVETNLIFGGMEPGSLGYIQVDEVEDGSKVTWGIDGTIPFPWNIFMLFGDGGVGADFENGLSKLKDIVETMEVPEESETASSEYDIVEVRWESKTFIGKRAEVPFSEIGSFFGENLPAVYEAISSAGIEMKGQPFGLYYSWDEENMITDMVAAIPVTDDAPAIDGYEKTTVDSSSALMIAYYGSYEGSEDAHYAMSNYMLENDIELNNLVLEEYVTDPSTEPDTSKWLTNIYYLTK